MIDLRKNKDAAKLPRNRWESVKNGTSELSKIWYTTKRVSDIFNGKVEYDPYTRLWKISIWEPGTTNRWSAGNGKGYKQLGRAKTKCINAIFGLYCKRQEEQESQSFNNL